MLWRSLFNIVELFYCLLTPPTLSSHSHLSCRPNTGTGDSAQFALADRSTKKPSSGHQHKCLLKLWAFYTHFSTYIVYVIPLGAAYFILFIGPTAAGLIILLQDRHWTLDTSWRRTADLLLKVGKIVLILFSCLPHCTDNKNVTTPFDDLIASRPWQMMEQQQCISNNNNNSSSTDCHWDGIILVVASSASSGGGHQQCGGAVVAAVVLLLSPAATRHTAPDTWARASPRTASRDGHRQHWIARYLHRITRCLQCLGVTIMLIKLEHTKVLAKWTWTCWGISRSRSAR